MPKTQKELSIQGHSIETRVYSEQPYNHFLPGNGALKFLKEPREEAGTVRIESGIREKDEISIFYDPMIAKVVVWGEDRASAIDLMEKTLKNYQIYGLPTNIHFLKNVFKNSKFREGGYDTNFI